MIQHAGNNEKDDEAFRISSIILAFSGATRSSVFGQTGWQLLPSIGFFPLLPCARRTDDLGNGMDACRTCTSLSALTQELPDE